MAYSYASNAALEALIAQTKKLAATKVDVVEGKALSTNDLTDELVQKIEDAYNYTSSAVGERNVIVGITVDGAAVTVDETTRIAAITIDKDLSTYDNTTSSFQNATQVSTAITTALTDYYTSAQVDTAIATAVADAQHLKYEIVTALPEGDAIDTTTIYMVAKTDTSTSQNASDGYVEYMYLNSVWEVIGDTSVDLTNYYTKTEMDTLLGNYVLASDMTEITADEVATMFTNTAAAA